MKALESNIVLLTSKQAKLAIPVLMFLLTFSLLKRDKPSLLGIWRRVFQSHNCYSAGEEGSVKNTLTEINIFNSRGMLTMVSTQHMGCSITLIRNVFSYVFVCTREDKVMQSILTPPNLCVVGVQHLTPSFGSSFRSLECSQLSLESRWPVSAQHIQKLIHLKSVTFGTPTSNLAALYQTSQSGKIHIITD